MWQVTMLALNQLAQTVACDPQMSSWPACDPQMGTKAQDLAKLSLLLMVLDAMPHVRLPPVIQQRWRIPWELFSKGQLVSRTNQFWTATRW